MPECFFVSDLHGHTGRYDKLFKAISGEPPAAIFLGGDLLPHDGKLKQAMSLSHRDFVNDYLAENFRKLRGQLGEAYPSVFLILGNDDARYQEAAILAAAGEGIWSYIHNRKINFREYEVYGYAMVPPTPFRLKDWERYDVSRFVDPGCISPESGWYTVPVSENEKKYATIQQDLDLLTNDDDLINSIFLFHTPPYQTALDRAALDGKMIDYAPLDVHVGSIAVKRFIEGRQPLITLHGHVHESARITDEWQDKIGRTFAFSAAHDGPELALVRFDPEHPEKARRELL